VMWFPLHKSEIRCPGVPGKAIDTHLLRILPLYRMIAKMQFPKCKLHQNAILAIFRELHFFRVDLGEFIDGRHLENRMTVRKGIPRLGKHRKESDFGTKCPEVARSVPTPEHAAGMGQETFSGRTATESKMEGTHER